MKYDAKQETKEIAKDASITPKQFRELLNEKFGFTDERWGARGVFGATKRQYGDYLWHQDRVMFNQDYKLYLDGKASWL